MLPKEHGVIVRLNGGLGNQLFQYATGRSISIRNGCPIFLDLSVFNYYKLHNYSLAAYKLPASVLPDSVGNHFEKVIPERPALHYRILRRLMPSRYWPICSEKSMAFHPEVCELKAPVLINGYWQSEKYFVDIRQQLLRELTLPHALHGRDAEVAQEAQSTDAISLHVRRADYVTNVATRQIHGTCSVEYYAQGLKAILPRCDNPCLFVFSDDASWARENIRLDVKTIYVDHNGPDKNYEDLRLMSLCRHHIIANSSFSWWGAWLNAHDDKVIVSPRTWFADSSRQTQDIIPSQWIKI